MDLKRAFEKSENLNTDLRHPDYKGANWVPHKKLPHEPIPAYLAMSDGWEVRPRSQMIYEDKVRIKVMSVGRKFIPASKLQDFTQDLIEEIFN